MFDTYILVLQYLYKYIQRWTCILISKVHEYRKMCVIPVCVWENRAACIWVCIIISGPSLGVRTCLFRPFKNTFFGHPYLDTYSYAWISDICWFNNHLILSYLPISSKSDAPCTVMSPLTSRVLTHSVSERPFRARNSSWWTRLNALGLLLIREVPNVTPAHRADRGNSSIQKWW